ncbi:myosin-11-like [Dorcoceras hygrometricum]|uniref:Myosin-11-like n=1 Tax=Dorcoceras hygrometricum TaxID=472368 RepID=A0A2Z7DA46_9LAMI|nr:myosin-11-like [Dorcoceras hygrometricum]
MNPISVDSRRFTPPFGARLVVLSSSSLERLIDTSMETGVAGIEEREAVAVSAEPSTAQLGKTDSSQMESSKLKIENDSLRTKSCFSFVESISEETCTKSDLADDKFKKINFVKASVIHDVYESVKYDDQITVSGTKRHFFGNSRRYRSLLSTFEVALDSSREALSFYTILGGCCFNQISRSLVVVIVHRIKFLSVLWFDPMSLWGLVVLLLVLFSGNPGFTSGRGFHPAGGAPGGG